MEAQGIETSAQTQNETTINPSQSFPLPTSLSARVTVKVGREFSSCRSTHGEPFQVEIVVAEGPHVLRAKIKAKIGGIEQIVWDDVNGNILFPPKMNATQRQYQALSSDGEEFKQQLERLWQTASRRRTG